MGKELKEIQAEVDEMSKAFDRIDGAMTAAPSTEVASTKAPSTESPSTSAPKTEAPSTSAPSTKAPTTEAPKEEDEETELEKIKKENEELRKKVAETTTFKTPKTKAPTTDAPPGEHDFVGGSDLEELMRDPKEFNKLLNKVYAKGVMDSRNMASEKVLRSIPDIVKTNIETVTSLKKASDKFYEDNKDLAPFKKVVASVFEEVAAENPDRKFDQLLTQVATEARKRLELSRQAVQVPKDKPKAPVLPKKKGTQARQSAPELKGIEAELAEMDKVLNS